MAILIYVIFAALDKKTRVHSKPDVNGDGLLLLIKVKNNRVTLEPWKEPIFCCITFLMWYWHITDWI